MFRPWQGGQETTEVMNPLTAGPGGVLKGVL